MPSTEAIDHDLRVVRITITGGLTAAEMIESADRVAALIGPRVGYSVVSDHRGVTTPATPQQLEVLVDHLSRRVPAVHRQKWAIVTASPASFGMMRMFSVLAERIPIRVAVFLDPIEAMTWLATPRA